MQAQIHASCNMRNFTPIIKLMPLLRITSRDILAFKMDAFSQPLLCQYFKDGGQMLDLYPGYPYDQTAIFPFFFPENAGQRQHGTYNSNCEVIYRYKRFLSAAQAAAVLTTMSRIRGLYINEERLEELWRR